MEPDEPPDNFGFSESLRVLVDDSILTAQPGDRAELYLNWLDAVLIKAAGFRGWEEQPLRNARQYCIDRQLRARFESSPKQSPDRRHKAVLSLEIDDDGWRHLALKVRDRAGQVVAPSAQRFPPFFLSSEEWRRIKRQMRWTSVHVEQADSDRSVVPGMVVQGIHWITATVGRLDVREEESPKHPLSSGPATGRSDWLRDIEGLDERY